MDSLIYGWVSLLKMKLTFFLQFIIIFIGKQPNQARYDSLSLICLYICSARKMEISLQVQVQVQLASICKVISTS